MEKFTKAQDGVSKLPPLKPVTACNEADLSTFEETKKEKQEGIRKQEEKMKNLPNAIKTDPTGHIKGNRAPNRTTFRAQPNKAQRPNQQNESLMERLIKKGGISYRTTTGLNKGQRPNQVKQEAQPRNEREKWKLMIEPFYKDKTKDPYFLIVKAEQIAKKNYRTATESCLQRASKDLEEKVKTKEQHLPALH